MVNFANNYYEQTIFLIQVILETTYLHLLQRFNVFIQYYICK